MSDASPDLNRILALQRAAFVRQPSPPADDRRAQLDRLRDLLLRDGDALAGALSADFGHRPVRETRLLEIFPSLEEVNFARARVARWMRPLRRGAGFWFLPGRARIVRQPLGVVGIVVPWNYPLYLTLAPLAGALAAGNRVMLKLPERVPRFGEAFATAIADRFSEDRVAIVRGDAEAGRAFCRLPFDHLLFTGATGTGREVMRAAAGHLTPVTLELGGKCPAIVAPGYPVADAAAKIVWGKGLNAGQTCIAPDYVLVPRGDMDGFVAAARAEARRLYPGGAASPDYAAQVDARQMERQHALLMDALARGATAVELCGGDTAARKFPPTVLTDVTDEMRVMQEEIFGPLLPVIPYVSVDDALAFVAARPRPLSLYWFDHDHARTRRVLETAVAGGVTVNDTILHIAQCRLPFGGVGASGMGRYHGEAGFETFSRRTGVFLQSRFNALRLLKPPYGPLTDRLLRWMIR